MPLDQRAAAAITVCTHHGVSHWAALVYIVIHIISSHYKLQEVKPD